MEVGQVLTCMLYSRSGPSWTLSSQTAGAGCWMRPSPSRAPYWMGWRTLFLFPTRWLGFPQLLVLPYAVRSSPFFSPRSTAFDRVDQSDDEICGERRPRSEGGGPWGTRGGGQCHPYKRCYRRLFPMLRLPLTTANGVCYTLDRLASRI